MLNDLSIEKLRFLSADIKSRMIQKLAPALYNSMSHRLKGKLQVCDLKWSLENLKRNGFSPKVIIDIGAYMGTWTTMAKMVFPDSRFLMIEANPDKESYLRKVKLKFYPTVDYCICLLGALKREAVQFFQIEGGGSSVMSERSNVPRKTLTLSMDTLDNIIKEKNVEDVSFLKIDVQGYEIEVLKGATNTLKNAQVVLLEVSFLQYNTGGTLLDEMIQFMKNNAFVAYDICSLMRYGGDGSLIQIDMIFVKQDSPLRRSFFNK